MGERKQVKIGAAVAEGDETTAAQAPRKEEVKKDVFPSDSEKGADLGVSPSAVYGVKRGKSMVRSSREIRSKDIKAYKPKTFKELMEEDVKPIRLATTHFPHYQDHYHYPGYIIFTKRNISETQLDAGWDEKADNERLRKAMISERLKKRKKMTKPGLKLKREPPKSMPIRFDDQEILKEMIVRRLSSKNPRYPQVLYQWHYYYGEYREMVKPCDDHQDILRQAPGLIHVDSIEAQWQKEEEGAQNLVSSESEEDEEVEGVVGEEEDDEEEVVVVAPEAEAPPPGEEGEEGEKPEVEDEPAKEETEEAAPEEKKKSVQGETPQEIKDKLKLLEDEPPVRFRRSKKLFNLFNFTDRGIQGEVYLTADKSSQTTPVPMGKLNQYICNYVVFDVYQKDIAKKEQMAKEKADKVEVEEEDDEQIEEAPDQEMGDMDVSSDEEESLNKSFSKETAHKAKLLERMVVQNTLFDYTADMQFYEDPLDEINKEEGSLLTLWTFKGLEYNGLNVTCIQFSPSNPDIFGVSHGSFDFSCPIEKGYLSLYSIKDPLNPEYRRDCKEGVTAFDYHPGLVSYIAYATYGGAVHCCDTRDSVEDEDRGLHSALDEGHQSIIWKIMWDPHIEELTFYTISADGYFFKWNVRCSVIVRSLALQLNYPNNLTSPFLTCPFPFIDEITQPKPMQAVATTMELDPQSRDNMFIGTSDGMVLKCCLLFTTDYLHVYHSHTLPVSKIHFNTFMNTLFVTAAEDRKVNIHEDGRLKPLYTLTQSTGVVDVMWAPHSSTVFALITSDCRISVYDLNINSNKPICHQFVLWKYGRTTLTKIIFHPTRPIIFVGDSSGTITSLKLSPNLRLKAKKVKRQKAADPYKMEIDKLDHCLNNTREPDQYPESKDNKDKLVTLDSESDEEEFFRIGSETYKMSPQHHSGDISRIVKNKVLEKYHKRNK